VWLRQFLLFVIILSAVGCAMQPSASQQYSIGIVNPVFMREPVVEAFQQSMADLGYVEGINTEYLYNGAIRDEAERDAWAAQLVAAQVDLIVGIATPGALSAKKATDDIPIIFFPVTDPIGSDLVASLQTPGNNATGITNGNPHPLRLEMLLQMDPSIEAIYAPYDADSPPALATLPTILASAEAFDVEIITRQVKTQAEILDAIDQIPDRADAIFIMPDPRVADYWQTWSEEATRRGIPFSGLSHSEVEAGVLMAYGEVLSEVGEQAANMADDVLRGAPPSEMPVQTANFFLSLNMDTADDIGLVVPEETLQRATYLVYETGADE